MEGGVTAALTDKRAHLVRDTLTLLQATAARRPVFGCHGMHEWAMVYRSSPSDVRHSSWQLRLAPAELDAVVESAPLRCTHFDAFRFFTEPARPLNVLTPSRAAMPDLEQGGCLHTNMDLYRYAQALPAGFVRARCGLLRARARDPHPGHACFPVRPARPRVRAGRSRDRRRQGSVRGRAAAVRLRAAE